MPSNEELINLLKQTSRELGLESGFYDKMLSSSDWEFVLKLSALFEAALLEGIVNELKNNKIKLVLSYLELANTKCSKVELAKSLELISREDAKFIRKIAEIRNRLAHRIDQRYFSVTKYVKDECKDNSKKLNSIANTLSHRLRDQILLSNGVKTDRAKALLIEPKEIMLANAMDIITNIVYLNRKI